jgi:predicted ribosomally synthesized peptide with SipW-like signal peptide
MTSPATRPVDAPVERHRVGTPRRALTSLGSLGIATFVLLAALSGVGGTYAIWSDQQTVDGGTLTSGTAELEAIWLGDAPAHANLLPGKSVPRDAQLHNRGDVPLALGISATTQSPGFEIRAAAGECAAEGRASAIGVDAGPLTSSASGDEAMVLQADESVSVCITVATTPELLPGEQLNFTIDIEGTQVR